nr:enoyl-ACP reductase FabV [Clostridium niameyense]
MSKLIKVKPKLQGNISRAVNPLGCRQEVLNQINYIKKQGKYNGPKKVLILGASSSYGLASRISLAFGAGADTIGVSFERGPKNEEMLGSAGWYNNIYFKEFAQKENLIAKNFIGDAFSNEMKEKVISYIKNQFGGKIDLVVYSLASPKRIDPNTGQIYTSVIKTIDKEIKGFNVDLETETLFEQTVKPATEEEIQHTIKVMGGEDWELWINSLKDANVLNEGFKTVLYSYIGPKVTYDFYHKGTLGFAKADAEIHKDSINNKLKDINGKALICVSKAVTTKASCVIPIMPLYCIALYKVMKEMGTHETPIMHKDRMFRTMMYGDSPVYDEKGRLRADSLELEEDTQKKVLELFSKLNKENFKSDMAAFDIFKKEFMNLSGFMVPGAEDIDEVDYDELLKLKP